jgi:hypothetical protein
MKNDNMMGVLVEDGWDVLRLAPGTRLAPGCGERLAGWGSARRADPHPGADH